MAFMDIKNPRRYPSLFERRQRRSNKPRMTHYDFPMDDDTKPLPVAPYGEFLESDQKFVLEQALNELSRRNREKELVIDAALDELRRRRRERNSCIS